MPQPLFDVFFKGSLLPDADPRQVRDRLAALFGLKCNELDRLFDGTPVCVKRAVDVDTAAQIRGRFRDAGALVDIRPAEAATKPAPPAASAAHDAQPRNADPPVDTGDAAIWTLTAPNTGSLADCARPVAAAPLPDITTMDLAPAGTALAQGSAPPAVDIDISHLSVAPANTGSLEDCRQEKPARPIGDIAHLRLDGD